MPEKTFSVLNSAVRARIRYTRTTVDILRIWIGGVEMPAGEQALGVRVREAIYEETLKELDKKK